MRMFREEERIEAAFFDRLGQFYRPNRVIRRKHHRAECGHGTASWAGCVLCLGAGTGGTFRVPSREVLLVGLDRDFRDAPEVDRDHRGDVRDGVLVSRDIAMVGEFRVEPLYAVLGILPLDSRILGTLANPSLEKLM